MEAELGFDIEETAREVERCLTCAIQTDFTAKLCTEGDACIDICPLHCLTITENGIEAELRTRLTAPADNPDQAIFASEELPQPTRCEPRGLTLLLPGSLPTGAAVKRLRQ